MIYSAVKDMFRGGGNSLLWNINSPGWASYSTVEIYFVVEVFTVLEDIF
jgi:hypothetical protein